MNPATWIVLTAGVGGLVVVAIGLAEDESVVLIIARKHAAVFSLLLSQKLER